MSLAIAYAHTYYDVVIVAAAGNSAGNSIVYPAGYSGVVGVSGVNSDSSFANNAPCGDSSNYGSHVDIAAPFTALSTVPDSGYASACGTSMAAPHVTGVVALMRALHPTWNRTQVINRLFAKAHDLGAAGRDDYYGYGIVDALAALAPDTISITIAGPTMVQACAEDTWTVSVTGGTAPYSYQWTVEGSPAGDGSSTLVYTNWGGPFSIGLTVTDSYGYQGYTARSVSIDPDGGACSTN
jgi:subtilisin family serine protease